MTNTNEPQDIFNEPAEEQSSSGEAEQHDATPEVKTPEVNEENAAWNEGAGTDSVEEAFLALIQSNKQQEGEAENAVPPQDEIIPEVPNVHNAEQEAAVDDIVAEAAQEQSEEVEAFLSLNETVAEETPEPQTFIPPIENEAPAEQFAQPVLTDFPAVDLPDTNQVAAAEKTLTDALSETIAESLAEIQAGQPVDQVADETVSSLQPEPTPPQPTILPEFPVEQSASNALEGFPAQTTDPVGLAPQQPSSFVPEVPQAPPFEAKQDMMPTDVMGQHHTFNNPIKVEDTKPSQDLNQIPAAQFGNEFQQSPAPVAPAAQTGAPVSVDLAARDTTTKTNVDPEFQALVQWSNSDVEPSHHGPHDIPNFLSQKREEESNFSFKSVFVALGISAIVVGMFYVGYQLGATKDPSKQQTVIDVTPKNEDGPENIILEPRSDISNDFASNSNDFNKPQASILEFSVANLSGVSGKPIPMNIKLSGKNLGLESMLLFRGIPEGIHLSKGVKKEGVWSVRISDLKQLALNVPEDYRGKFDFEVFAFKDKESGPERRLASVQINKLPSQASITGTGGSNEIRLTPQRTETENVQRIAKLPPETNQPPSFGNDSRGQTPPVRREPQQQPGFSPQVEASMLQRANRLLKNGDISGARLIFEHVAIQGSKHAAFALARTYDEDFLDQLFIRGLVPQMETAVKWYKKAASMGHKDAARRLNQLGFR